MTALTDTGAEALHGLREGDREDLDALPPHLRGIALQLLGAVRRRDAHFVRALAPAVVKVSRRRPGKLRLRQARLDTLAALAAGKPLPTPCLLPEGVDAAAALRVLQRKRGVAAAAAEIWGESLNLYKQAQSTRRRLRRTM
jgi:hypothetical protein